jgi:2-oxoglutarate dehydrogenase complex dehydrogenase (E1) component-like enzyme
MTSQTTPSRLNRASNEVLDLTSFLNGANAQFIEQLYAQYQQNPDTVDESWRTFFAELGENGLSPTQLGRGPQWRRDGKLKLENGEIVSALTASCSPARRNPAPAKTISAPPPRNPSAPSSWCAPIA